MYYNVQVLFEEIQLWDFDVSNEGQESVESSCPGQVVLGLIPMQPTWRPSNPFQLLQDLFLYSLIDWDKSIP